MNLAETPWTTPLLFGALFVAMWIFVSWLLSHLNGWVALAKIYRAPAKPAGAPVRLGVGRIGPGLLGQFRNVLTMWVSAEGLQLHMLFLFAINSRDLFFPWADVSVSRGRHFFADYVELHFRQAPEIPLRIYGKAGERLREVAGAAWPESPATDPVQR